MLRNAEFTQPETPRARTPRPQRTHGLLCFLEPSSASHSGEGSGVSGSGGGCWRARVEHLAEGVVAGGGAGLGEPVEQGGEVHALDLVHGRAERGEVRGQRRRAGGEGSEVAREVLESQVEKRPLAV